MLIAASGTPLLKQVQQIYPLISQLTSEIKSSFGFINFKKKSSNLSKILYDYENYKLFNPSVNKNSILILESLSPLNTKSKYLFENYSYNNQLQQKRFFSNYSFGSKNPSSFRLGRAQQFQPNHSKKLESLLDKTDSMNSKVLIQQSYLEGFKEAIMNAKYKPEQNSNYFFKLLFTYFPVLIISFIFVNFIKGIGISTQMVPAEKGQHSDANPMTTKFSDVCGVHEAKAELVDVVNYLTNPLKYTALGAKLPKGILLYGPPGNGKTLLARAIAGEAGVPFFHISASQFEEKFVGVGASRIRTLFMDAKNNAPCVIFIDEIDSIGVKRSSSDMYPYANQTINQLLAEMDGFIQNSGIICIAATNRLDVLDPALIRAGRFDSHIFIGLPSKEERLEVLKYYTSKIHSNKQINLEKLSKLTSKFSSSEISNLVNQAALHAAAKNKMCVDDHDFTYAFDKIKMGPQRINRINQQEVNWRTAIHEAGHAIVSYFTKGSMPINKVTILPRGHSLGHTSFIPENEHSTSKKELNALVDTALGGRAAEELIFGPSEISSGCSSDLGQAEQITMRMVNYLGMDSTNTIRCSSEKNTKIIEDSLNFSYQRVLNLLKEHKSELIAVAQCLVQYETLNESQFLKALNRSKEVGENVNIANMGELTNNC